MSRQLTCKFDFVRLNLMLSKNFHRLFWSMKIRRRTWKNIPILTIYMDNKLEIWFCTCIYMSNGCIRIGRCLYWWCHITLNMRLELFNELQVTTIVVWWHWFFILRIRLNDFSCCYVLSYIALFQLSSSSSSSWFFLLTIE